MGQIGDWQRSSEDAPKEPAPVYVPPTKVPVREPVPVLLPLRTSAPLKKAA